MTTKTIILQNGEAATMTYEEVREMYYKNMVASMRKGNDKFFFNKVEEADFMQELEIELWRAYEQYDHSQDVKFGTYLFIKLQKGIRNATYARYAQKNKNMTAVSMNAPHGEDDLKLEDMFAIDDTSSDGIFSNELVEIIKANVNEKDQETLKVLLGRDEYTIQDYATKLGISRQAANQRVVKLRRKLQKVVSERYLEIAQ